MRVVRHLLDKPKNSRAYETLLHITCRSAYGERDREGTLREIWEEFEDRDVRRKDGKRLTYYGSWSVENTETSQLLKYLDGQCGAWAKTFINCLWHQGIKEGTWTIVWPLIETDYGYLFVKNWQFKEPGSSGNPAYPYLNISVGFPKRDNRYEWVSAEVTDKKGIPGQGTSNPASLFNNHQFVMIRRGGLYYFYDPSYGKVFSGTNEVEALLKVDNGCIDGFALPPEEDEDGRLKWLIRKNSAGFDLGYGYDPTYAGEP